MFWEKTGRKFLLWAIFREKARKKLSSWTIFRWKTGEKFSRTIFQKKTTEKIFLGNFSGDNENTISSLGNFPKENGEKISFLIYFSREKRPDNFRVIFQMKTKKVSSAIFERKRMMKIFLGNCSGERREVNFFSWQFFEEQIFRIIFQKFKFIKNRQNPQFRQFCAFWVVKWYLWKLTGRDPQRYLISDCPSISQKNRHLH